MTHTIAVLGAGAWGTALAKALSDKGHQVHLWSWQKPHADAIQRDRTNQDFLPGFELAPTLRATSDLPDALGGADMVLTAVPTHVLREVLGKAAPHLPESAPILSVSKGIEISTLKVVSGIFEDCVPKETLDRVAYLGGPSFAKEVAAGMPTAVVVACTSHDVACRWQEALATDRLRVYTTDDVIGIELGGALKNVIAIAAGVSDGLGFGHNSRAALITRGLAEMTRLATKMGAHPLTLAGLGGMGDLVLTCTGDLSRNRTVGLELGKGRKLDDILAGMTQVAEGVRTTKAAYALAQREGCEMPITDAMYRILYEGQSPLEATVELMTRRKRAERD
ncbi:NAD(P)H-dependent glycerol-3-phosphate dehydrogenase [Sandaracinus amylolyticus]|uniref:Glycerol-3-phosphate dehydrogenase [NAD(P)+] n=1 Tax=Sandaracinus amylolyticus TaxID=927083 RepID=A0A0F6W2U9_9BACT|nr:NAD(P)H-dependent glycerol-3-phosphate dehydrogenase [Sandaracinus amylolyticus]AKF06017.1 Glycerol-3-phosphate dehydrogenase [Sandaracinus amylolyticus]